MQGSATLAYANLHPLGHSGDHGWKPMAEGRQSVTWSRFWNRFPAYSEVAKKSICHKRVSTGQ